MGTPKPREWVWHKKINRKHLYWHFASDTWCTYFKCDLSWPSLNTYCRSIWASSDKSSALLSLSTQIDPWSTWKKSSACASPTQLSVALMLPAFLLYIQFPLFTCYCQWIKDVLAQFTQVIPLHVAKGQVNAALCPFQQKNIHQLSYINPKLCNLAVVDQPWKVKKCNWYCPIQTKAKCGHDVVVMSPSVVVTFLYISPHNANKAWGHPLLSRSPWVLGVTLQRLP